MEVHPPPRLVLSVADPAPLVATLLACDVVAASPLQRHHAAVGTWFHVVFASEGVELLVTYVCAADIAVSSRPACHAHALPTGACGRPCKSVRLAHVVETTIARTPTQVWVKVDNDVELEAHILLEYFLRAELLHVCFFKLNLASMLHARNFDDLPVGDVLLQMLRKTNLAKLVAA